MLPSYVCYVGLFYIRLGNFRIDILNDLILTTILIFLSENNIISF